MPLSFPFREEVGPLNSAGCLELLLLLLLFGPDDVVVARCVEYVPFLGGHVVIT